MITVRWWSIVCLLTSVWAIRGPTDLPEVFSGIPIGGTGSDRARGGLAIDPVSGHVYLGIQSDATFTYGNVTAPVPAGGSLRFGIIRFDSGGSTTVDSGFETRAPSATNDYLMSMAIDPTAMAGAPYGVIVVSGVSGAGTWGWGPTMTVPQVTGGTSFVMAIPLSSGVQGSSTSMNNSDPLWLYYSGNGGQQSAVLVDTARGYSYWGTALSNSINNTVYRPPPFSDIPTFCPQSPGLIGAVFKFNTASGAVVWKQCLIPSSNSAYVWGMAMDSQGYLAVTGSYGGSNLLSNGVAISTITKVGTALDAYVLGVNPHGVAPVVNWGIRLFHTGGAVTLGRRVEFDQYSNIYVQIGTAVASSGAVIKAGTGSRMNITFTGISGSNAPIVIKLSNNTGMSTEPTVQWMTAMVTPTVTYSSGDNPDQIIADRTTGDLYYIGQMQSTALTILKNTVSPGVQTDVALGGELVGPAVPTGGDAYAMRFNGTTGLPVWQFRLSSEGTDVPRDARQHPDGRIFTTGDYSGFFNISTIQSLPGSKRFRATASSVDVWFASFSDVCPRPTCVNGGTCLNYGSGNFTCDCPVGTLGTLCQTNIDDCASQPCVNGASCVDAINGFTCSCVPGYSGLLCQTQINECGSQPCKNSGTCTDLLNGFTCACLSGFSGATCETNVNECASNPCVNGASCVDGNNGFTCVCVPGYSGLLCQTNVNECASQPCRNSGTCADSVNGFTCTCLPGFSGLTCETNVNECASNPCRNSGTCNDATNGFTCLCLLGFSGLTCETNVDECASQPCQNGGTCFDGIGSYSCACTFAFTGLSCQTYVDLCFTASVKELFVVSASGETESIYNTTTLAPSGAYTVPMGSPSSFAVAPVYPLLATTQKSGGFVLLFNTLTRSYTTVSSLEPRTIAFTNNNLMLVSDDSSGNTKISVFDVNTPSSVVYRTSTSVADTIGEIVPMRAGPYVLVVLPPPTHSPPRIGVFSTVGSVAEIASLVASPVSYPYAVVISRNDTLAYVGYQADPTIVVFNLNSMTQETKITINVLCSFVNSLTLPGNQTRLFAGCDDYSGILSLNLLTRVSTLIPSASGVTRVSGSSDGQWVFGAPMQAIGQIYVIRASDNSVRSPLVTTQAQSLGVADILTTNSSGPCMNGGFCGNGTGLLTCACGAGYGGPVCQTDINECASQPCRNGGSCTDRVGRFECTCVAGYNGVSCETDIDECASQPCRNSGTCTNLLNSFVCTCLAGFSGLTCATNVNECASQPCRNSGTCNDVTDGFTCSCLPGYSGLTCQTNIDECASNPCRNSVTCTDSVNGFTCTCLPGFSGLVCETNVNECASDPCRNSGTCNDLTNGFTCTCLLGYSGLTCETNVNECASDPCRNSGTCTDLANGFTCVCLPGYSGLLCETDVNECGSQPCANDGTCSDTTSGYTCACVVGYSGRNCETDVNECVSAPCANGGTCVDSTNRFSCQCVAGYSGVLCQTNIDECASRPCQNSGSCADSLNGFTCTCLSGYSGAMCETNVNECASNPCRNGGTCDDAVNFFTCRCVGGFSGLLCDTDVNECASNPCRNGGVCVDGIGQFSCACATGYTGVTCQTDINECGPAPCVVPSSNVYNFEYATLPCYTVNGNPCSPNIVLLAGAVNRINVNVPAIHPLRIQDVYGFGGHVYSGSSQSSGVAFGAIDITIPAIGYPTELWFWCQYHPDKFGNITVVASPSCVDNVGNYTCQCTPGTTGDNCQTQLNVCLSSPCQHGSTCSPMLNSYVCACAPGWGGANCETAFNITFPCTSMPCRNHGLCVANTTDDTFTCWCTMGFSGVVCQTDINECASQPCRHGGTCVDNDNGFSCLCVAGYCGPMCQTEINECGSSPCASGGTCTDLVNGYQCSCVSGFSGSNCQTNVDECASTPCRNSGSCVDLSNGFSCVCVSGYSGVYCQTEVNECGSSPCRFGGTCTDRVNGFTCACMPGYSGSACETEINECASTPCRFGASCVDGVNGFTCACTPGYSGRLCETDVNECTSQPCLNGGSCLDHTNGFSCQCPSGFSGRICDTNINECASQPCAFGGTCTDATNGYTCACVAGSSGARCQTDVNECGSQPCRNSGTCVDRFNSFDCVCSLGYSGLLCQTNVNECASQPCRNGGSCIDGVASYTCQCAAGFSGTTCNTDVYECASVPCQHNGTCVDGTNSFVCACAPGWSGGLCQTDVNECLSRPCQNSGTCVDLIASYRCDCPPGITGTLCQTNVDECTSQPCRNNGTCVDLIASYRCDCPTGFVGTSCQTDENDCASQPCLNSGTCTDRVGYYTCTCPGIVVGDRCQYLDACASAPCPFPQVCSILFGRANCACPVGFGGGPLCQEAVFAEGPISGQGSWLVDDESPDEFVADVRTNGSFAKEGAGYLYLSGRDMPDGAVARLYTPAFNKTTGDPSIQSMLSGGQFYGGNTYNHSLWVRPVASQSDGSSVAVEITSNILKNVTVFSVGLINGPTGLNITGGNASIVVDPAVYHLIEVTAIAINHTNTTRGIVVVDSHVLYDGVFVNSVSPPPPMNQVRFVIRSSIGAGFVGDLLTERVYDTPQVAPNNIFQTGFNPGPCYQNVTNPCLNNGQCVPNVVNVTCVCSSGFVGPTCAMDVDECASDPCYNGAACIDRPGGFECDCTDGYSGALCVDVVTSDVVPTSFSSTGGGTEETTSSGLETKYYVVIGVGVAVVLAIVVAAVVSLKPVDAALVFTPIALQETQILRSVRDDTEGDNDPLSDLENDLSD